MLLAISQCLRAFGALEVIESGSIKDPSKRILLAVLCFCGIANLYVYNAGLISYLLMERYEMPIKELGDFLANPGYKLLVLSGASDEDFLKYSYNSINRQLWKTMIKEKGNISDVDEAVERLLEDDKNIFFGISPEIELIPSIYPCHVEKSKVSYYSRPGGYGFRKDSPYIELFSHQIIKIIEMGLETEIEKTMKQVIECSNGSEKHFRGLSYNDVIFVFGVLLLGCLTAIVYSAIEFLLIKYKSVHDRCTFENHESIEPYIEKSTNFEVEARKLLRNIRQELIQDQSFTGNNFGMDTIRGSRYNIYAKINEVLKDSK